MVDVCNVADVCEVADVCKVSDATLLANAELMTDASIVLYASQVNVSLSTKKKQNISNISIILHFQFSRRWSAAEFWTRLCPTP